MTTPAVRWIPCELHAHSVHSDGRLTVAEMAAEARRLGLELVALTDHNTNSGVREIAGAERASGVTIVPGMELTTFYGHLLAWGTASYVDWRGLTRETVGDAIGAIHAAGGLAGVAHPFNPGSPFCTGCFWDFEGPDWSLVDFVEVWSEADPWRKPKNRQALRLWDGLLGRGYRVAGVSARDFHAPDPGCLPAVTYLGVDAGAGDLAAAARDALRGRRAFATLGPLLWLDTRGVSESALLLRARWATDGRRALWEPDVRVRELVLRGGTGELARAPVESLEGERDLTVPRAANRWVRAELHGLARGDEAMIAFTNPVWVE